MNIESKWLEDFLSLAETRSFSRSAAARHVTQPAFSRRIRALEQTLGVALIDRSQQPVGLSPAGRLFRITARNLVDQLRDSVAHMQSLSRRSDAVIDFALSHSLSLSFFPRLMADLQTELGGTGSRQLVANVDDSVQALKNGICDFLLAYREGGPGDQRFQHLLLSEERLLPVCQADDNGRPRYWLAAQQEELPLLVYPEDIYLGRLVRQLIRRPPQTVTFRPCFESPLADSLKLMAMQGMGVAWVPGFAVEDELQRGFLAICGDQRWQLPLPVCLYRDRSRLSPEAEQLWQVLESRYLNAASGVVR